MLDVYFTIDVEVWCRGWHGLDAKFRDSFDYHIHGPKRKFGLPHQLQVLGDHGLRGVCFVETLFAERFGTEPLAEIVGVVEGAGHEVQLHLHPEWINESLTPALASLVGRRRSLLGDFSVEEQTKLVEIGLRRLQDAGSRRPNAFRAGNFAFNPDILIALQRNGIAIDASYNASMRGPDSGLQLDRVLVEPHLIGGVMEVPMTVFHGGIGSLRHAQLTACSFREMEGLLWKAVESQHSSFVVLSHGSELTSETTRQVDDVVLRRFHDLCKFLERHRDVFNVRGFHGAPPRPGSSDTVLSSPYWKTGLRVAEQLWRRVQLFDGPE